MSGYGLSLIASVSVFFAMLLTSFLGFRLAQIHIESRYELKCFAYANRDIIMWALALWHGGLLAFAGSIAVLVI